MTNIEKNKLSLNSNFEILYENKKVYEEILSGYVYIKIEDKKYRKHRVIWELYNNKEIPKGYFINHIDGNKKNNHPLNLELNTPKENTKNWYYSIKDKINLEENFKGKSIYAYNIFDLKEKYYEKIMDASRDLKISDKSIALVLSKRQKTTHNFIFSYKKIKNIKKYIQENINFNKINQYKKRKIKVFKDNEIFVFHSTEDCSIFFEINKNVINRYLTKKRKNPQGYNFVLI